MSIARADMGALAAVRPNGEVLVRLPVGLRGDKELVLAAVRQDGGPLKFASEAFRAERP